MHFEYQGTSMEAWLPLFDIFLNSPAPDSEASLWLQEPVNSSTTISTSTSSFLSLLSKPIDVSIIDSSSPPTPTSSPRHTKSVMWIQTLPNAVQSRILSFLRIDNIRFCKRDLCSLANNILSDNHELEFWVKKAALNLLDVVSESNYDWVSGLNLDSSDVDFVEEEFEALPTWLEAVNDTNSSILPWLPISCDELRPTNLNGSSVEEKQDENSPVDVELEQETKPEDSNAMEVESASLYLENVPLADETQRKATYLKSQIIQCESTSKAIDITNEIFQLCFGDGRRRRGDLLAVFSLIQPWEANDETASILLSHLSNVGGEDVLWQCQVLCAVILPKVLVLTQPASRVLVSATIEFCKVHQKASVEALLYPLILREDGINTPICDVVTRIIKECLHPAHVSSFCQRLLSGEQESRRLVYLPCHQCLISNELVWTESLFTLFQNILNHNVYFTPDSVERLASVVQQLCGRYSKSLKFSNFLLSLVTKCESLLKPHKILLIEAVEKTDTFMTKSILSKLWCL